MASQIPLISITWELQVKSVKPIRKYYQHWGSKLVPIFLKHWFNVKLNFLQEGEKLIGKKIFAPLFISEMTITYLSYLGETQLYH